MAGEFTVDFNVLEHLRGYPEDLRRYSNLMTLAPRRTRSPDQTILGGPWGS